MNDFYSKKAVNLLTICFLYFFSASLTALPDNAAPIDEVVAVVNDGVVLKSELLRRLDRVAEQIEEKNGYTPPRQLLVQQVLDKLITDEIQLQMAKNAGIEVSDIQLNQTLHLIAEQNKLSLNELQQAVESEGLSFDAFREDIRKDLQINQFRQQHLSRRIEVSDEEIDNFLKTTPLPATNIEYKLGFIHIPSQLQVTEQELDTFLSELQSGKNLSDTSLGAKHTLEEKQLEWRKQQTLPTVFEKTATSLQVGEYSSPIENENGWYIAKLIGKKGQEKILQTHSKVRHILIKTNAIVSDADAKIRLDYIKEKVNAGETFDELAKAYSQDPGSAQKGGDLGWSAPGTFTPKFEEIMTTLEKNEISKPFKTEHGWHIVQLLDRKQEDVTEKALRQSAKNAIQQRKFNEELQNWLIEIRDQAYVDILIETATDS